MPKLTKYHYWLWIILIVSFLLRVWRLNFPQAYVFDEVYYPFTAKEYLAGNPHAWEWLSVAPKGFAYAWVNPPLAQELMALGMKIVNSTDFWAFRLPGVIVGTIAICLVYLLGKRLFNSEKIALISALLFSIDGLNFVQSRTGMLDIYLTTFILCAVLFFSYKKVFLSALFVGLAIATKWTGIYLLPIFIIWLLVQRKWLQIIHYIYMIPLIYLLVYLPFFLTGHDFGQFQQLLHQEWWYHLHLKADHAYASAWWTWPLGLVPIWYYVEYYAQGVMSNIFAASNPVVFWFGSISIVYSLIETIRTRNLQLAFLLAIFGILWLPWAFSPRIMFLYYFAPAVPFMCLSLGYQLEKLTEFPKLPIIFVGLAILSFVIFLPFYTGIPLPKSAVQLFFLTNLAKNPFGS